MHTILGGNFESALVHAVDAVIRPERNRAPHPYYMFLNRKLPAVYFERAATFIALSEKVSLPQIDWAMPPRGTGPDEFRCERYGIEFTQYGGREWDDDTKAFANIVLDAGGLPPAVYHRISAIDAGDYDPATQEQMHQREDELRRIIAHHYLCRLFLQLKAAAESKALLVLPEDDLELIATIGRFLSESKCPTPFAFPDLTGQVVIGEKFAGGLLNFAPPDVVSLSAIRDDEVVQRYAGKIDKIVRNSDPAERETALLQAMKEAHESNEAKHRTEEAFEISAWVLKPLHYVPGVAEALAVAEDLRDVASSWVGRKAEDTEWYLVAARMTNVGVRDFLSRKGNQLTA